MSTVCDSTTGTDYVIASQRSERLRSKFLRWPQAGCLSIGNKAMVNEALQIEHDLGRVVVKLAGKVNRARLKKMIRATLDCYLEEDHVPAAAVSKVAMARHGAADQLPGYYLRLYRLRADLTQVELAEGIEVRQHHLSEMEHNKRPIGKAMAKKLAEVLGCDYRKLL